MEAERCLTEAEAKLKKGGFFKFISGGPDYEQASALFSKAASIFKLEQQWPRAAAAYERAAEMENAQEDYIKEVQYLTEAGHCYRKYDVKNASRVFEKAAQLLVTANRFGQAGRLMKSLAEDFDSAGLSAEALDCWQKATKYFQGDEYSAVNRSQAAVRVAELDAKLNDKLGNAISVFENEGTEALKSQLGSFGAKEHFFRAGILLLAQGDAISASVKCEKYGQLDPRFANSREGTLLNALCKAFEKDDIDAFVDAIAQYDRITSLDAWKVHFLNKAKSMMTQTTNPDAIKEMAPEAAPIAPLVVEAEPGMIDLT